MATGIDTAPRVELAVAATEELLRLAEIEARNGGEAGERLLAHMPAGPHTSMGELEARLALGTLASAQRRILKRLEALEEEISGFATARSR